ncbi:hypothetical protein PQX77_004459 [Marasmius sp. AFHP31]|nr:hypothetical protein PQX77_004459 [Marasmius sp. AFHP31]
MTTPKGLSFVFIEPGSNITEAEHYDWYDNEHSPARLTVPGFYNALRYKAVDSQKPSYLTLYDISEPSIANGPDFEALRARASERDTAMLGKVQFLNRRTYELIEEPYTRPETTDASLPGKFVLMVSYEIKSDFEEEFNRWYKEEHIPEYLAKVPDWLRCRRYKLYDNLVRGALEDGKELQVCKYLALHDFSCGPKEIMSNEIMKASIETPYAKRVEENALHKEVRILQLHRVYKKPE